MIKRIACFSKIKPSKDGKTYSEQVFSIFNSIRVFNKEHQIVGAFVVHGEMLLQILEGDIHAIAKALYRVNRDPRISDVSVVLNKSFETSAFTYWSIKIVKAEGEGYKDYLSRLKQLIAPHVTLKSALDQAYFKALFGPANLSGASNPAPAELEAEPLSFRGKMLTMSAWPRPTRLRLNAPLMKLCQVLIGHSVSYQSLLSLKLFDKETELETQLKALHKAGALDIFSIENNKNVEALPRQKISVAETSSRENKEDVDRKSRFSKALKQFIHGQEIKRFNSQ